MYIYIYIHIHSIFMYIYIYRRRLRGGASVAAARPPGERDYMLCYSIV